MHATLIPFDHFGQRDAAARLLKESAKPAILDQLRRSVSLLQEWSLDMGEQPSRRISSADSQVDSWTWIILAGLLLLGALVGVGGLAITSMNQAKTAPGSQTVPPSR
jgi:hypothetical protein